MLFPTPVWPQWWSAGAGINHQKYKSLELQIYFPETHGMNPSTLSLVSAIEMFQQNHQLYFSPNLGIRYFRGFASNFGSEC